MTATIETSRELIGASTDDLADALAQRIELLDSQHLFDAYAAATARYWRRRAAAFEAARPARDGFHGRSAPAEVNARWERLTATARACRNRALYAEMYGPTESELALFVSVAAAIVAAA
ncbi:hypothetical protein [Aeromicrobium sp.]|uniref:hypothetical protein n=1 Tax=Aeromicrobium sp. TaxID=1871063 RepID=UPI0030BBDCC0